MAKANSNTRIDLFVVADAVLISLACMLVFLAYREINAAPVRYAQDVAQTILAVTDDLSRDDPLDGMRLDSDGELNLARQIARVREQVGAIGQGADVSIYSDHPAFARITRQADPFLESTLASLRSGAAVSAGETVQDKGASQFLAVAPLRAARDCQACVARGLPDYRKGDIIGLKAVLVPIGDQYARIIGMLLYAFAILALALMCVLGIIFPTIKRVREERARMSDLTHSLEREAVTDPLTGLFNRRYFEKALDEYVATYNAKGEMLGLLLVDLDHFKHFNDEYGHDTGDLVLKEVAVWLKAITRDIDIVARVGGEEFAVITPHTGGKELSAIAQRYCSMIGSLKINIGNAVLKPTISIGVATNENGAMNAGEIFKAADEKLYEAKRGGRNRVAA